ncbi:MAG: methylenetetrahydrofolate--tRNA-(uracil(54)-C(5))-methyltransferase (FADH(2)-oxidizing) TrmFO [Vicinamibacterales bacterium]
MARITIAGGGLAGCEAAWQAASRGVPVVLHEMRPLRPTAVHKTDGLAELVCSNSFRGDKLDNAVGLLKEEMRRLGSLVMRSADETRVPAGAALAVDRDRFSSRVTEALGAHPLISIRRGEVTSIPSDADGPVILATGPLTSDALAAEVAAIVGSAQLYFYDAISPIVLAETIDRSKVYRASRWGRSLGGRALGSTETATVPPDPPNPAPDPALGRSPDRSSGAPDACGVDDGQGDYLNCPFTREEYGRFHDALMSAEKAGIHEFDQPKFFEGCLPIEVMAARGVDTLRFGPMKPVGLRDPRTGREPYAVVQLRQDNIAGDHFSLVGFQTQMKWGEQARVLRMIPGLEGAEFVRFGMIHRNTYVNAPTVLRETWQTRMRQDLFFAGQMSGVEGYVESAASGLIAGLNAAALVLDEPPSAPPRTTAIGALGYYASHADPKHYVPSNIAFGLLPPLERAPRGKKERNLALSERALNDLERWQAGLKTCAASAP